MTVERGAVDPRNRPSLRAGIAGSDGRLIFTAATHEVVDLSQDTRGRAFAGMTASSQHDLVS